MALPTVVVPPSQDPNFVPKMDDSTHCITGLVYLRDPSLMEPGAAWIN